MSFFPGNGKRELQNMLIVAWNALATARGEPVSYAAYRNGFDWMLALLVKLPDQSEQVQIVLFSSPNEARTYRDEARRGVTFHSGYKVLATSNAIGMLTGECIGLKTFREWREIASLVPNNTFP